MHFFLCFFKNFFITFVVREKVENFISFTPLPAEVQLGG